MSIPTVDEARTVHPTTPDRLARLPLRAELFLLAHDDDTGEPTINIQSLAVGLAGAILLELWLDQRVAIGWTYNPLRQGWVPNPGRITIANTDPAGDPLGAAAMAVIRQTDHTPPEQDQLRRWLRIFAATDLYERVRANMLTVGVLRRTSRRRLGGLVKTDAYLAVDTAWAVRARGQIRSILHGLAHPQHRHRERPDDQCAALSGLVHVLELAPFLYLDLPNHQLNRLLRDLGERHNRTIHDVITAVDAGRGDLAVQAMR
ncbi:GOLPH3/VPS74 family protein [Phytohabitans aurantiacus]|uniref:GPP34 family phosphoprotein n=1 Tax=Phytohabitans aurantiacus TaxID=3016789 RepID=A0ABQ5RAP5_9ACTN|nr:GPP34 family phosphoprotein [Phytohabitans aurantiacus]GLI03653.1 hypothetical protein Pa4123_89310 [Phytohabitans aurantiacus]